MIGNPPWGAKLSTDKKATYKRLYQSAKTIKGIQKGSLDTYSLFIELGYNISSPRGVCSSITPLSITSSESMEGLHKILLSGSKYIYVTSFGDRPRRIFENAEQQVSIVLFQKQVNVVPFVYTTGINKRNASQSINVMIETLSFTTINLSHIRRGRIPKIGTPIERKILERVLQSSSSIGQVSSNQGLPIYYRKAGGRYYKVITLNPTGSSAEGEIIVRKKHQRAIAAIMSSSLYYWYWLIHSDWHNMRTLEVSWFPIPKINAREVDSLNRLFDEYYKNLEANSKMASTGLKRYFARKSKHLIDKIDDYICPLYGLTLEETEFIKNYEIEFRMSDED